MINDGPTPDPSRKGGAFVLPLTGNCLLEAEQLGSASDGGQKLEGVFIYHLSILLDALAPRRDCSRGAFRTKSASFHLGRSPLSFPKLGRGSKMAVLGKEIWQYACGIGGIFVLLQPI